MSDITRSNPSHTLTGSAEIQNCLEELLDSKLGGTIKKERPMAWRGFGLCYRLSRQDALKVFQSLRDDSALQFNMLIEITAVDWMDRREPRFEVVYHLLSLTHMHRVTLKIDVTEENPEVDSIRLLWPAANFLEREVWDMFGISFKGHGDLRRVLMYDEFQGHPLRKDYPRLKKQPRVELRLPELQNSSERMLREELVSLPTRRGMSALSQIIKPLQEKGNG